MQGQTARATPLLEQAAAANPKSALARQNLSLALLFAGRRAEAADCASAAIALEPANATTRYIRAYLSFKGTMLSPNPQMESDLRAAVAADANFAPAHALLAAYLVAQDAFLSDALESARKAVSLEPSNSMYQLVWAKVLGRTSRYDESRAAAARALELATEPADREAAIVFLGFLDRNAAATSAASSLSDANMHP